jgi:hypothetical protein
MFSLSACFLFGESILYSDMFEYTEEEILNVAKEKYAITNWIYTGSEIKGETSYNENGEFKLEFHDIQYSTNFVNEDNIEKAMTAFAGKNGGHDIQGMFRYFLCYVALGKCSDDTLKFVYYNKNIHKDAEIIDTLGSSDYNFEVLPKEINNSRSIVDSKWTSMQLFLNKFKDLTPKGFIYSGDKLTIRSREQYNSIIELEFYKENGNIVYDIYYIKNENNPDKKDFVYSSSERYEVIYNYYGLDKSLYFNISQTVSQSTEQESCMSLKAKVSTKEINGTVIYSRISYQIEYQVYRDNKVIYSSSSSDSLINTLEFERGWMIDKIEGVDHSKTAKFILSDFYIFYEKNIE